MKRTDTAQLIRTILTGKVQFPFRDVFGSLPNPDAVLRKLGQSQKAYDAIAYDAHVIGEVRPLYARLLQFESRINKGGESAADMRAFELCQSIYDRPPALGVTWQDMQWSAVKAAYYGYTPFEVTWERQGQFMTPATIEDKRRDLIRFEPGGVTLVTNPFGQLLERIDYKYKMLITRHMPESSNPYGFAIYSGCYWPYVFKHSGFEFFVNFCERFGIPIPVGKYLPGTTEELQQEFADKLQEMIESGLAVIPDTGSVDLIEPKVNVGSPSERLIEVCNKEISKALTSQTAASESNGEGSRALSETHKARNDEINASMLQLASATMNTLFQWITELNFPAGTKAPYFEFFEQSDARESWTKVLDQTRKFLPIGQTFAYEVLQIPQPGKGDALLPGATFDDGSFSSGDDCAHEYAAPDVAAIERLLSALDDPKAQQAIADTMINPLIDTIQAIGPDAASAELLRMYPTINSEQLREIIERVLFIAEVWGRLNSNTGV